MAEETNKRMRTACAVSFTLQRSRWFQRVLTSLNTSIVSALNWNLRAIMTTAACTFLLIAFGVAIASEDQLTNGKHIYPKLYY